MNRKTVDGYRIIVVEDDREMRESLVHLLGKAGWQADALSRGEGVGEI